MDVAPDFVVGLVASDLAEQQAGLWFLGRLRVFIPRSSLDGGSKRKNCRNVSANETLKRFCKIEREHHQHQPPSPRPVMLHVQAHPYGIILRDYLERCSWFTILQSWYA
jgi:hypothetical protein